MSQPRRRAVRARWKGFQRWRRRRPFLGGALLLAGAVCTGYLPRAFESFVIVATDPFAGPALLIAVPIAVCGLVALAFPSVASLFGALGMLLSALALVGALGGFLVGTVLSGLGGLLCFAWTPTEE